MLMYLILLLIASMSGLDIYRKLRAFDCHNQEPEYVVLIRGMLYSLPLFALIVGLTCFKYPSRDLIESFRYMASNYKYLLLYFITVQIYSNLVFFIYSLYRKKVRSYFAKRFSKFFRIKTYTVGYSSAWEEICEEYMKKNDYLVGRLMKDGKTVALGQIDNITSNQGKLNKDISFINQQEYLDYFPEDESPKLENICTYVDMQLGYVLELYKYNEES